MKSQLKKILGVEKYERMYEYYIGKRIAYFVFRRSLHERLGSFKYSKVALGELDDKLIQYLNFRNGFFVEAGANDGVSQSNTYYLEKALGWQGVLIEPIPRLFKKCVSNRPKSSVINGALVSPENDGTTLTIYDKGDHGLMCKIAEAGSPSEGKPTNVCGKTLTTILAESKVSRKIDFFSLDVEGYEVPALQGLDFRRFKPRYILVETAQVEKVDQCLLAFYDRIAQLTFHDYLYRVKTEA